MTEYQGYSLEEVAKEVAQTYGGEVEDWKVSNGKLTVYFIENGEQGIADLQLSEIKEFMEM